MFKRRKPRDPEKDDNPLASRVVRGDDSPTEPLEPSGPPGAPGSPRPGTEAPTRRVEPGPDAPTRIMENPSGAPAGDTADPPVGALLVIDGPGFGGIVTFGYGMNTLGRGPQARIRLDLGDERISREDHARITFDPESGRCFLQHGGGPNLTYHGDAPVLEPVELADGDRIRVGDTILLLRLLVGPDFDWRGE